MSNTIFQALSQTGPRTTKSLGFFESAEVAAVVAGEVETGSVEPIIVCTSTSAEDYVKDRLVIAGLAKLSDDEKTALGLG